MTSFVLLDCDVFWSPRLWCFPILKIFIFDLADRNVLQRMVLSLLLQRLQACWANGDHDIQVKPMVMIMNAIMIHRWACHCFSSVIVFHIEPRMLAQDLMRFGIIYFIFLMGFGQVCPFSPKDFLRLIVYYCPGLLHHLHESHSEFGLCYPLNINVKRLCLKA